MAEKAWYLSGHHPWGCVASGPIGHFSQLYWVCEDPMETGHGYMWPHPTPQGTAWC